MFRLGYGLWAIGMAMLAVSAGASILGGPVTNQANGRVYLLLGSSRWTEAAREARGLGGELVTINDRAEQEWVYATFSEWAGVRRHLWLGLYDANKHSDAAEPRRRRGEFLWLSADTTPFRNWSDDEPNDAGGKEEVVLMWSPNHAQAGRWGDAEPGLTNLLGDPIAAVMERWPARPTRGEDRVSRVTPPDVIRTAGSTRKICQLVGDFDKHLQRPTENQTRSRYRLASTDLGVPFQHRGRVYLAFGDIPADRDRDPLAYTTDTNPEDGLSLTFVSEGAAYRPIIIPGMTQQAFEVPLEGVSIGGKLYLYHTTDHSAGMTMGRSVLTVSEDDGHSFRLLYTFSRRHFINVNLVEFQAQDWPGFPPAKGQGLAIFGSGRYRESNVRLAYQPASKIEHRGAVRYFSGLKSDGGPAWSRSETEAISLFDHPRVGELSVTYNRFLRKWLMLYNAVTPRGINFRTADQPWGPWSEAQLLFEPWADGGYCHFMHTSWKTRKCDNLHDEGHENTDGGEYGAYVFETLTTGTDGRSTIYFTMSTWNPYTVVLMKSELTRKESRASGGPGSE